MRCSEGQPTRTAFTLIELVVSLAILSLLSLIVFTRSTQQMQNARVTSSVERLAILDQTARAYANRSGSYVTLRFAPLARNVRRENDSDDLRSDNYTVPLPGVIQRMRIRTDRVWSSSPTKIAIGRNGRSRNYALRFDLGDQRVRYFAVIGATGQTITTVDESEIDAIFE